MIEENATVTNERTALVLPRVAERRRSIVSYTLAMSDSLIGGFDAADFREDITERKFLWFHHFLVNHPDGVKHILQDNAANYIKAPIVRPLLTPALGNGLVTSEGEAWRRGRTIMAPAFNAQSVAGYADIIAAASDAMIRKWDADRADGPLDTESAMAELTLDIISRAMFSSDSELIRDTLYRSSVRYQAEMTLSPVALIPGANRVWALYKTWRAGRMLKDLNALMGQIIDARKKRPNAGSHVDLLDRLLDARDPETGRGLSAEDVRDQMVTVFVAGHETTALALCWTWFLLSQHAAVEQRLWAELDETLKGEAPTYDDIRHLPYTRMIFDEALRLFPPIHSLPWRQALDRDRGLRAPSTGRCDRWHHPLGHPSPPLAVGGAGTLRAGAFLTGAQQPAIALLVHSLQLWAALLHRCVAGADGRRHGAGGMWHSITGFASLPDQSVEPRGLLSLQPRNGLLMHRIRRAG